MALDEKPGVERIEKGGVTVLQINKRSFAVGLRWVTLKSSVNYMKDARKYGKDNDMDIVAIRDKGLVTQGGFVSKKSGVTKGMYSAASALTDILGASWLAVFQVGEDLYYLAAADKHAVLPDSDVVGTADYIRKRMMDLNAMFEWRDEQITAPESWNFGGTEKTLESLLTSDNVRKEHRLKNLFFGLSGREWIQIGGIAALLAVAGVGAWIYLDMQHRAEQERVRRIQEARKAEIARLDEEQLRLIQSASLTRPWTLKPGSEHFMRLCEDAIYSLPISIGGWVFDKATCKPSALDATYIRKPGTSNNDYLAEFSRVFPGGAVTTAISDDSSAGFAVGMDMVAGGDDKLQESVRDKFVSHFQRMNLAVKVEGKASEVIVPEFLPNGSPWPKNVAPPTPNWNTYAFVFESVDKPSNVLLGLPAEGVRVAIIEAQLKEDSTSFSWKTVGEIYGLQ